MKIYVGNLTSGTSVEQLRAMFAPHGEVERARLAMDKETGEMRGFGYVQMRREGGSAAIKALDNTRYGGHRLRVKAVRKRRPGSEGGNGTASAQK